MSNACVDYNSRLNLTILKLRKIVVRLKMSTSVNYGPLSSDLGKMPNHKTTALRQLGSSIVCLIAAGER